MLLVFKTYGLVAFMIFLISIHCINITACGICDHQNNASKLTLSKKLSINRFNQEKHSNLFYTLLSINFI